MPLGRTTQLATPTRPPIRNVIAASWNGGIRPGGGGEQRQEGPEENGDEADGGGTARGHPPRLDESAPVLGALSQIIQSSDAPSFRGREAEPGIQTHWRGRRKRQRRALLLIPQCLWVPGSPRAPE